MFTANSLRWALTLLLFSLIAIARATLNYSTCLDNVKNGQYLNLNYSNDSGGAMDSQGHFLNLSDPNLNRSAIVAMPYGVCIACGGSGPEVFDWSTFATNFSAWLLPFLALVSQLPFGSQLRQQNILSVFLTIGSPALAAYSLIICVLNWAAVPRAFEGIQYPNVEHAWRILGSLQHSPLYIRHDSWALASLVTLPENDQWWKSLAKGLDYEETWKTAVNTPNGLGNHRFRFHSRRLLSRRAHRRLREQRERYWDVASVASTSRRWLAKAFATM